MLFSENESIKTTDEFTQPETILDSSEEEKEIAS